MGLFFDSVWKPDEFQKYRPQAFPGGCRGTEGSDTLLVDGGSTLVHGVKQSPLPMERGSRVIFYPAPDHQVLLEMKEKLRKETEKASGNKIDFEQAKEICPPQGRTLPGTGGRRRGGSIGYLDGGETCRIIFDDARVHTIINGDTGSGKTNLLHILITNILLRYPPEEVQMYLIDFKHGTEFRKYINYNLPSFQAISICNEPEFALQILQAVRKELDDRVHKFGNTITNIRSYNQNAGKRLPRIILILDELYELVMEAKASKAVSNVREQVMRLMQGFSIQARGLRNPYGDFRPEPDRDSGD